MYKKHRNELILEPVTNDHDDHAHILTSTQYSDHGDDLDDDGFP